MCVCQNFRHGSVQPSPALHLTLSYQALSKIMSFLADDKYKDAVKE